MEILNKIAVTVAIIELCSLFGLSVTIDLELEKPTILLLIISLAGILAMVVCTITYIWIR
jgi:hypothetical protein